MADDGNPDERRLDFTGESEEGGGDTTTRSSSNSAVADGLSSLISSVMTTFDSRAEATTRSQDQLASSLDRLTGELDKLLEDAPSPFIMQHAARISGVRKRVKSLNSVLKSVQRRIDNMDRILSAGLAHVCVSNMADDSLLYISLRCRNNGGRKQRATACSITKPNKFDTVLQGEPPPQNGVGAAFLRRTPPFSQILHHLCQPRACSIFSDVAGDITIIVDGESFLLHKFPLVARSGKIRKLIADAKNTGLSKLELCNLPGGPEMFELAAKFCYGMNFVITTANVAPLRCAAEYLEMTENYQDENLLERTEAYLTEVVCRSLEKSVEVLSVCENLLPLAEEIGIPERCISAIAMNVCKEQLVSGLSRLDCDSSDLKDRCLEWWVEDLSVLGISFYGRVVVGMGQSGVRTDSIVASLMHYAQTSLKGIGKPQIWNPARTTAPSLIGSGQRTIVETLVNLLPNEKKKRRNSSCIPLNFLFGMTRVALMVDATLACRLELERRIACKLEMALLDDLLIPSVQAGDSLFDVDTIHRILVQFLQRIEEEEDEDEEENDEECGYESEEMGSRGHGCLLKVGRLVDAYLAEIAPDPYLSLDKFIAMIEAHPVLNEQECKKLCKLIDCQKLSQEACNHAAQNDRLPVHLVVRVLYFEQVRLKNGLLGSCGDGGLMSQKISSGVGSAAMSPRDTYASLRRENRELKLEISRMRVRLSDLEKEQVVMKQGMMDKSRQGSTTLLTSISKGISRFGIFRDGGGIGHNSGKKKKKQLKPTEARRSKRHSLS
ncbi:Phototropic-responsive NPH3 family protein [Perilla frutescens var. frutescens]|nr:Phototropic-responsive NPH3 family protein [Perilla frutescens var. frutescens]